MTLTASFITMETAPAMREAIPTMHRFVETYPRRPINDALDQIDHVIAKAPEAS